MDQLLSLHYFESIIGMNLKIGHQFLLQIRLGLLHVFYMGHLLVKVLVKKKLNKRKLNTKLQYNTKLVV